ncbi:hypothetical protein PHLGIDRAFT_20076 [Phlebiopsis gigantea 11061_1 CR5-6]|uniref:CsbD-like domain-containing protein n=1 Tax=Phlebiopsis gigantea (strain 11061_1 CR5-6) TaxID=745531 RepID=A0A0C3NH14_PHLG1|nr:hypothetical protein PHLGIDRAFT_20076 [Phlebiopsis gigantea 11061_1 CR5-6]
MSTPTASTKSIDSSSPDARNTTSPPVQQNNGTEEHQENSVAPEDGYPEQRHAGAVGYGPEFGQQNRPTASEKIQGMKEEIAGKVTRNAGKVEHGKQMRTGELKRKQKQNDDNPNPLASVDDDEKKANVSGENQGGEGNQSNFGDDHVAGNAAPTSVTDKRGPGTHPTEVGAQEQAATTAPEGTAEAEVQRRGENVNAQKQIDERNAAY